MRYRILAPGGDFSFGHGAADFYVDSPQCVAQRVLTRLRLLTQEWFLDLSDGTPYATQVLGKPTQSTRDEAIQQRVLGTPGVTAIAAYTSTLNGATRAFDVEMTIDTQFGRAAIATALAAG